MESLGYDAFELFSLVDKETQYSGSPGKSGYNMLFFEDQFSDYGHQRVQAVTAMKFSLTGEISDTDIIVNSRNFKYFYDENYNRNIQLARQNTEKQRALASSITTGFWFRLKQRIKKWFFFPFKAL